jgi:predicted helicase
VRRFVVDYNSEVHRHNADPHADWPDRVNWSRDLKLDVNRGRLAEFDEKKIIPSLYRPFSKRWLFFDRILNEEVYQWPNITVRRCICLTDIGSEKPFMVLACDTIPNLHLVGAGSGTKCFPLSQYQVKGESDPNREDDPGYIVRLVGQVVRVSVATVEIVKSLPTFK